MSHRVAIGFKAKEIARHYVTVSTFWSQEHKIKNAYITNFTIIDEYRQ